MFAARPAWLVLTALVLTCCSDSTADAQFLRIGPLGGVQLRLPRVSVDVGPGGATSVRAPFTAVDTPGYRYGSPYYGSPYRGGAAVVVGRPAFGAPAVSVATPAPAGQPLSAAQLSDEQLLQELATAGNALAQALAARQGGDVWVEFLRPQELAGLAQAGDTATLTRVLQRFDGTRANGQLAWLNNVAGFAATQDLLRQWVIRQSPQGQAAAAAGQPTPAAQPTPATPPQPTAEPTRAIPPQPAAAEDAAEAIPTPEPEATSIRIEA